MKRLLMFFLVLATCGPVFLLWLAMKIMRGPEGRPRLDMP